jgi:hypothetical protein
MGSGLGGKREGRKGGEGDAAGGCNDAGVHTTWMLWGMAACGAEGARAV